MKQNSLGKIAWLILLALLLAALTVMPAAAQEPEEDVSSQQATVAAMLWNPVNMEVPLLGATAVNRINVEGASDVFAFTLNIGYDANVVTPDIPNIRPGRVLPGTEGVDYVVYRTPLGAAPACAAGVTPAGFSVTVAYVSDAGPIVGSGSLLEIPWIAHNGGVSNVCIDATSQLADQVGNFLPIPGVPINTALTVVAPANRFRIGLQGGKPSFWTAVQVPVANLIDVQVNSNPCIVDPFGNCNPFDGPPYAVSVNRAGYLDVNVSFASNNDVRSIYMLAGDLNDDRSINILDLVSMATRLGQPPFVYNGLQNVNLEEADFTGPGYFPNGIVDIADLVLVARNFGKTGPTDGTAPETDF